MQLKIPANLVARKCKFSKVKFSAYIELTRKKSKENFGTSCAFFLQKRLGFRPKANIE